MKFSEVNRFILDFPGVSVSMPFSEDKLVYSFKDEMFAILDKDKLPLRISLKCDPGLSVLLRQKYDEVMPGDHLDEKTWNTIIMSGQLEDEEIKDLIRHSYLLTNDSGTIVQANEE